MSEEKDIKKKKGQINIELDEKIAEGTYSNLAIINHSVSEFVLDFVSIMPGTPKSKVKSRIILTPQHAKRLHQVRGHWRVYRNKDGSFRRRTWVAQHTRGNVKLGVVLKDYQLAYEEDQS